MCCGVLNLSKLTTQQYWQSQARKSWSVYFYKHRAKRVPGVLGFLLGQREQRTIENSTLHSVGQICLSHSPSPLPKAPSETRSLGRSASGLSIQSQILLIRSLCRCSCRRDKYCRAVRGRGAPVPLCTPASSPGADGESIHQAPLPDMGHGVESMNKQYGHARNNLHNPVRF